LASRVPHVFALLFFAVVLASLSTYVVPAGEYERTEEDGREVVVPGSYAPVEAQPTGFFEVFQAVHEGMIAAADIIFFIFIVGGAFGILQATGAIDAGIGAITRRLSGRELLLIPVIMLLFSFAGATLGMSEETLPFILIMVPLAIALGYDSMTGASAVIVGSAAGFGAAFLNPFTIGVAQGIAEVQIFSGLGFRVALWAVFTGVAITYVMLHARRVKRNPGISPVYEEDRKRDLSDAVEETPEFTGRHKGIVGVLALTLVGLVVGVIVYEWFITELAGLFLLMGVAVGIVGRLSVNQTAEAFVDGCRVLVMGALVVGIARAVLVVLENGLILDTILNSAAAAIDNFPSAVGVLGMFVFQSLANFIVPSGSGQAALTMPVMAPLADLIGVTRQTAVLAYQLGDGITNIITPTSGVLMGSLALAGISWIKWARWVLPLILIQTAIGAVAIVIAHAIGYQ
jgi:uncharacterized ion transporter superfamily protein YfcC